MYKILKAIWVIFESVCFALGFAILLLVLTAYFGNGSVSLTNNNKEIYCFAKNTDNCKVEEKKNEQN